MALEVLGWSKQLRKMRNKVGYRLQWGDMMGEKMQLRGESHFSAPADGSLAFAAAKAVAL